MQISFSFSTSGFNWFKNKSDITSASKRQPRRPTPVDYRDYPTANAELTQGLYHNSFPGLKLAGSMAYAPIAIPVSFMGLPVPVAENDSDQAILDEMVLHFATDMRSIHTQCHREGTIWIWPSFDARTQVLRWEFIPDEIVSDIIVDINTREIIKIITDEEILIATDYNETQNVRRRRTFTVNKVEIEYPGLTFEGLQGRAYRNPISVLPIPFANNKDGEGHRGYSDYERIIPDLKDYHDIDLAQSTNLAKFKPKMVQTFASSVNEWLGNNGYVDLTEIDIAATDFIMNKNGVEETNFIFPERAHQAYEEALKRKYRKLVEGSGLPELLWGVTTEGNHASAEDQMDTFVMYVKDKQSAKQEPYRHLFGASLQLLHTAGQIRTIPEIEVKWNDLSAVSDKVRAEIYSMYAKGTAELINVAGLTRPQLHNLWMKMYPDITEDDYEKFREQLAEMIRHKQMMDADYADIIELETGQLDDDEDSEEAGPLGGESPGTGGSTDMDETVEQDIDDDESAV
jgi:hypothetical protein